MNTVLYVSATGLISGAERSLLTMLDALDRQAWRPSVIAPAGPLLTEVAKRGVQAVSCPFSTLPRPRSIAQGWFSLRELQKGRRALSKFVSVLNPDLVHANTTTAMLYSAHLPSIIPTIWHVRDLVPLGLLGRYLYHRASAVAVISRAVHASILPYADDHGVRMHLLPPAVETSLFTPAESTSSLRAALGLPTDKFLIGLLAQFVPWKCHHLLLDALLQLQDLNYHTVLTGALLHGENSYLDELQSRITSPPLAGRITILPWQDDAASLISALDLCVLTSNNEPFGRVLIESMACGVPVIAVDGGGVRDIITPEANGVLVPSDATFLADAIKRLINSPVLRSSLAQRGRHDVMSHFGLDKQRNILNTLYAKYCTN